MKTILSRTLLLTAVSACVFAVSGCDVLNDIMARFSGKKGAAASSLSVDTHAVDPEQAKNDPNNPVIVKIDGEAVVRKSDFFAFVEQVLKAQPYLAQFGITSFESAPPQIQEQLIDAAVQQQLVAKWGKREKVTDTKDFQAAMVKMVENVKQVLIAQTFEKQIQDAVSFDEQDVINEYNNNKAQYIKEPAVLEVLGAKFASSEKADVLSKLVEQGEGSFSDLATEAGVKIENLGTIMDDPRYAGQSDVPASLRQPLLMLNDDQNVTRGDDGDDHWVLYVAKRNDPVYYDLSEIKPQVEMKLRSRLFLQLREVRLGDLRGQYAVDVDKEALGIKAQQQDIAALLRSLQAQQGGPAPQEEAARPVIATA